MASNNYVPVKVLQSELDGLFSESVLISRDLRLERALIIYRLGLIDDVKFRDLNREICKRFPADDPIVVPDKIFVDEMYLGLQEVFSNSELILISEELNVRMDQLKYLQDKYSQRSGSESFVSSSRDQLKKLTLVSNKIYKLISNNSEVQ